jgi:hypothetical protein
MAYDSTTSQLVLFEVGKTWTLSKSGGTWTKLHPSSSPPART